MNDTRANAYRLIQIFESIRRTKPAPMMRRLELLDLSPSHFRALHLLASGEKLTMKDLAKRLGMTPPSVTVLTRQLQQKGLIGRERDRDDRRVVLLSLTEEGRKLLDEMLKERLQVMERLLQGLSPEEQQLLLDLLARAVEAMQSP